MQSTFAFTLRERERRSTPRTESVEIEVQNTAMAQPQQIWMVTGVVLLYWTVAISLVFVNKHLLSSHFGHQDLTVYLSWMQCCIAVAVLSMARPVLGLLGFRFKPPQLHLDAMFNSDLIAQSYAFVISMVLNNLMLKHIDVAFYQVARSFTLVFTVLLSRWMLGGRATWGTWICCATILFGFVISVDQESSSGDVTIWGVLYGMLSSLAAAVTGIYFKRNVGVVPGGSLGLTFHNNAASAVILTPLVLSSGQMRHAFSSALMGRMDFWLALVGSGLLSLAMGWVSILQINHTSPTTHHVSNSARAVIQTLIALAVTQGTRSAIWWLGNVMVILGAFFYAWYQTMMEPSEGRQAR